MNIFEDLCGMSSLGNLQVNPQTVLSCTKTALQKTKEITNLIRRSFELRHQQPLLDFSFKPVSQALSELNRQTAEQFLLDNILGGDD